MILLVFKYLIPKGFRGITLFPFILVFSESEKQNGVLLNHEKIHIRQQLELLIFPFYFIYGIEFMVLLIMKSNWNKAYRAISFEKEAYINEKNLNYLYGRRFYQNFSYFARKKEQ